MNSEIQPRMISSFLLLLLLTITFLASACAPCQKVRWCLQKKNPPPAEEIVEASATFPIDFVVGLEGKF